MSRVKMFREIICDAVPDLTGRNVGCLLSAGVDSNTVLHAALKKTSNITVFSFRLEGRESRDFKTAKSNASALGLKFIPVVLPTDPRVLYASVDWIISSFGLTGKADIECSWPVLRAIDAASDVGVDCLLSGIGADGLFALSRKASIQAQAGMDDPVWLQEFRDDHFNRGFPGPGQIIPVTKYGRSKGVDVMTPYLDERLRKLLEGSTWRELNKPRQKQLARSAFPELDDYQIDSKHVNLQLGDSGISDNFRQLLAPEFNPKGYKSQVGIYNTLVRKHGIK